MLQGEDRPVCRGLVLRWWLVLLLAKKQQHRWGTMTEENGLPTQPRWAAPAVLELQKLSQVEVLSRRHPAKTGRVGISQVYPIPNLGCSPEHRIFVAQLKSDPGHFCNLRVPQGRPGAGGGGRGYKGRGHLKI